MAVFDVELQRVCVRVVYDGPASAGKTTNVKHLAAVFPTQRTTELYSPAELRGRTLYFDWLQIHAGVVRGFPLVCQVVTVPGQLALTSRRRHLLRTADVVVYVSESSAQSIGPAHEGLLLLDELAEEREIPAPIVLQANKQDRPGAMAASDLALSLGLHGVVALEAIASQGIGVVDTFVAAVREIGRTMEAVGTVKMPVRPAERPAEVLEQLEEMPIDERLAAEMLLEQTFAALPLESSAPSLEPARPPLAYPSADVAAGHVWPAHTGRATLERLEPTLARLARVPVGAPPVALEIDGLRFSTGGSFPDVESARASLVRAARVRTRLGDLGVPGVVLAIASRNVESFLWTIGPALPSFASELSHALETGEGVEEALSELARIVGLLSRHEVPLSLERLSRTERGLRFSGDLTNAPHDPDGELRSLLDELARLGLREVFLARYSTTAAQEADEREQPREAEGLA